MTDFGHCVRNQFRTPRPQLLAGDALPPCVVGKVLQRIDSAAARTCCPILCLKRRTTHSGATPAGREAPPDRGLPSTACEPPLRASVLTSTALFVDVIRAQRFGWFWAVFSARRRPIAAAFVPVWSPAIMAFLCQWVCCMRLPRCRVTRQHTVTHLLPSIPPLTLNGFCPVF